MMRKTLLRCMAVVLGVSLYLLPSVMAQADVGDITPTQDQVTLRFSMLQDPGEEGNVQKFIDAFNQKYPNIKVVLEPISGDYEQRLILQAASRTLPDLFWASDQGVQVLGSKNLMLDLDPYIAASGLDTSNFYQSMLDLGKVDGVQYMLPRDYNHLVTFYNIDMFKEAGVPLPQDGWTWQEFVDAAKALTKKDASGATTQYGVDGSNFNWWAIVRPGHPRFRRRGRDRRRRGRRRFARGGSGRRRALSTCKRGCGDQLLPRATRKPSSTDKPRCGFTCAPWFKLPTRTRRASSTGTSLPFPHFRSSTASAPARAATAFMRASSIPTKPGHCSTLS